MAKALPHLFLSYCVDLSLVSRNDMEVDMYFSLMGQGRGEHAERQLRKHFQYHQTITNSIIESSIIETLRLVNKTYASSQKENLLLLVFRNIFLEGLLTVKVKLS